MKKHIRIFLSAVLMGIGFLFTFPALSQGVTTAAVSGGVTIEDGSGLPGANVVGTHVPSGTVYGL